MLLTPPPTPPTHPAPGYGASNDSSLSLNNWPKRHTQFTKTFYSPWREATKSDKEYRGTSTWNRWGERGMGEKGHRASMTSRLPSLVHHPLSSPKSGLSEFLAQLHYVGGTNSVAPGDWSNLQPFSPPRRSVGGTESTNPLITKLATPATSPTLRCFQNSSH